MHKALMKMEEIDDDAAVDETRCTRKSPKETKYEVKL